MKLVFIHQNCPGQFKHLAPHLANRPGNEVVFITQPGKPTPTGVRKLEYRPGRKPSPKTHHYLRLTEAGILNGQAVGMVAQKLKEQGFYPDAVVAHMGWGEALYIKEVWPRARLLGYFEWYYHAQGSDVGFLEQAPPDLETACRIKTRNAMHLLSLESVDWGMSPTRWQWQQHPSAYRNRISVIHDGVDTRRVMPDSSARFSPREGVELKAGDEVVTYVARNLEPYRGFPTFMRAAERILDQRPKCHILVVGGDEISYGVPPKEGGSYRELMLKEVSLDHHRIHFLGRVPYDRFLKILQVSAAHIYLTVPFVLSWSMLEAMAAGCVVVGSRTPPVEEVIKPGVNGLLADFFDHEEVAAQVIDVLEHPDRMADLRQAARRTVVQRYDLHSCLRRQEKLITSLVDRGTPLILTGEGTKGRGRGQRRSSLGRRRH